MKQVPADILSTFADTITQNVLSLLGEDNVSSVFLSGGTARGEIAAFEEADRVEIYSDLDMFVVVHDTVDLETARYDVKKMVQDLELGGDGYRLLSAPDVGVYSEEDLMGQPARPGTVEIADAHVHLYGRRDVPELTRKFIGSVIDRSEALYLLENRASDLVDVGLLLKGEPSPTHRRYYNYITFKTCMDIVTAALIFAERFDSSPTKRLDTFSEVDFEFGLPAGFRDHVDSCKARLNNLQSTLAGGILESSMGRDMKRHLLDIWKALATSLAGAPLGWRGLVDWRSRKGEWRDNLKEAMVVGGRASISRVALLFRVLDLAARSPGDSLRLCGLLDLIAESESVNFDDASINHYVGTLTALFGLTEGNVYQRGRRLDKAIH